MKNIKPTTTGHPEVRITALDNDGALWTGLPMYFQRLFALDRMKAPPECDQVEIGQKENMK